MRLSSLGIGHLHDLGGVAGSDPLETVRGDDDELLLGLFDVLGVVLDLCEGERTRQLVKEHIVLIHDSEGGVHHVPEGEKESQRGERAFTTGEVADVGSPIRCVSAVLLLLASVRLVLRVVSCRLFLLRPVLRSPNFLRLRMRIFRQKIFLEARRVSMLLCDGKLSCGLAPRFRKIFSSKILCFSSALADYRT